MKKKISCLLICMMLAAAAFAGCAISGDSTQGSVSVDEVPEFDGEPYVAVNGNVPEFTEDEVTDEAFEEYSSLDSEGRCGSATACVGQETMPSGERGSIGQVKPTGWHTVRYDNVDGKYLYNRCHLIGYQLTGENANEKNLITGTRYMNVDGMLPFEDMVADYVRETGNHVMYRVTPVFEGDDPVASGVQMEAMSVEDEGESVLYNVYVYNNQPGITIDYGTGDSRYTGEEYGADNGDAEAGYIINTNTGRFHAPDCSSVSDMSEENTEEFRGTRDELIEKGYEPCGRCNP